MRLENLNLATHPFKNRKLPYSLAFLFLSVGSLMLLFSFSEYRQASKQNEVLRSQIKEIREQLNEYRARNEQVRQNLTPEQKALLIAAHKLVSQKSFGWSRLLSDLEQIIPSGVSVSRISVENIFRQNDRTLAELELGVLSRDYRSVVNMIEAMNSSGIFRAELRSQSLQKKDYFAFTEYKLFILYKQPFSYSVNSEVAQKGE
ncbi:MAG: hypothetical protein N2Z23_00555 [Pyrinomonadaceae bacterium]|nr:hypothetical protein [Pyrinomonadaceae bacterium]MCX7638924.1 hypothetical protein [Pyrinomonadaceae bacterium]MDW8304939.1 hypothetical protein [Acidobacteriota bacterium]